MSLTEAELKQITDAIDERLTDLATGQQMAVQLIQDTLAQLEQCQARLAALTADLARAKHHEIDAVSALQLYRELVQKLQERQERGDVRSEQQREHIKELEGRVRELERLIGDG